MISQMFWIGVGVAFGMSRYGGMVKEKFKIIITPTEEVVKFFDNTYGIRYKIIGITMYRCLDYNDIDTLCLKFKSNPTFNDKCKSTLKECQDIINYHIEEEVVIEYVAAKDLTTYGLKSRIGNYPRKYGDYRSMLRSVKKNARQHQKRSLMW